MHVKSVNSCGLALNARHYRKRLAARLLIGIFLSTIELIGALLFAAWRALYWLRDQL